MNDKMFDQTPGTDEAAFGISAQRSGLEKIRSDNQEQNWEHNKLEFCSVFSPDRYISVDKANRYRYMLTLSDPIYHRDPHKNQNIV